MHAGAGRGAVKPPIGIAFDGDLGNRIDAVLAVAMLNGLAAKGEARRISLSVSRPSLEVRAARRRGRRLLRGRADRRSGGGVGGNPEGMIGMPEGASASDDAPPLAATARRRRPPTARRSTRAPSSGLLDTAESAVLIRNMLLAQNDGNATHRARRAGDGPRAAARPVRLAAADCGEGASSWWSRRARFRPGRRTPSIKADVAAARKLFAEWPTPLVAVGSEVGAALPYPGASIEKDFAWSPAHPVVDAYRAFKPMPYDAPAAALAAVLYAVHPDDGYFKLSEPGTISVHDDGRTQFTPAPRASTGI